MDKKSDYVENFKAEINLRGYSKNTLKNYTYTIEKFLDFINKDPKEIEESDIKRYLIHIQQGNNATNRTIHRHLNAIKTFFKINKSRVAEEIKLPKTSKRLPKFLTIEDIERLLGSIKNKRDKAIIQILYACGIRISELVNLNREDIEGNNINILNGKGAKDRVVYIDEGTLQKTKTYLKTRKDDNPALFTNNKKERLTQRSIQRLVKQYAIDAGIKKEVTPHKLRHSFATHLLQNDADIMVIKELLGHSNLSTTQIYMHVTSKRKESVYNKAHPLASKNK